MEQGSQLSLSREIESKAWSGNPEPTKQARARELWLRSCMSPEFNSGVKGYRAECYKGPFVQLGSVELRNHRPGRRGQPESGWISPASEAVGSEIRLHPTLQSSLGSL